VNKALSRDMDYTRPALVKAIRNRLAALEAERNYFVAMLPTYEQADVGLESTGHAPGGEDR